MYVLKINTPVLIKTGGGKNIDDIYHKGEFKFIGRNHSIFISESGKEYHRRTSKLKIKQIPKKEGDMLKLTKDDIGKKFENEIGGIFTLKEVGDLNCSLLSESGIYSTCQHDGITGCDNNRIIQGLVKAHEPRWWLSQLPDADLFALDWIACDKVDFWSSHEAQPLFDGSKFTVKGFASSYEISGINMPKLNSDECLISAISKNNLRQWQKNNK